MRKLDRYIGIHVLLAILTVLGIIVGLALYALLKKRARKRLDLQDGE